MTDHEQPTCRRCGHPYGGPAVCDVDGRPCSTHAEDVAALSGELRARAGNLRGLAGHLDALASGLDELEADADDAHPLIAEARRCLR